MEQTPQGLTAAVTKAAKGASVFYYMGFILCDREPDLCDNWKAVRALAAAAYRLYQEGKVHLVQKKLGLNQYAYIAIKR